MTLEKAIVNLGEKAGSPGVAFVALSRVVHPDNLMLDDNFPSMSVIMKQRNHPSFQKRHHWERLMRARFSRTIRYNMRDASLFNSDRVWSSEDSQLAEQLLQFLRSQRDSPEDAIPEAFLLSHPACRADDVSRIWSRLHKNPHIFEVAQARQNLDTYSLRGEKLHDGSTVRRSTEFSYFGWDIPVSDLEDLCSTGVLTQGTFEIFARNLRPSLPPHQWLSHAYLLHKIKENVTGPAFAPKHKSFRPHPNQIFIFPYRSVSKHLSLIHI